MRATSRALPLPILLAVLVPATLAVLLVHPAAAHAAGPGSDDDDTLLLSLLWGGIGVFAIVETVFLWATIRFRATGKADGSSVTAYASVVLPVAAVVSMIGASVWALFGSDESDESPADPMTVSVNAFQYQWEFTYSLDDLGRTEPVDGGGEITVSGTIQEWPTLVLPVGEPVELRMTSNDVLHSLHIPGIANKLDIAAGQERTYVVTASEAGRIEGQCAELCGVGHLDMRFHVEVMERPRFDEWVRSQAATGGDR